MKKTSPTYSNSARTGEIGVNLLARIVHDDLGWIFKRNHQEHDFGIDGVIEIVSEDNGVTGRAIAIQIKTGDSYLKRHDKYGFLFKGEQKHFNYLCNYPLPVLLLIVETASSKVHWGLFDPDKTDPTPTGWKIHIPRNQILSSSSRQALVEIAGPAFDYLEEQKAYWALNEITDATGYLVLSIGRKSIETGQVEGTTNFFSRLCRNDAAAMRNAGKVNLHIQGYDDDPRELWEVPEVVQWFKAVEPLVRYWFFFLRSNDQPNGLKLLAACVCDATREVVCTSVAPEKRLRVSMNSELLSSFMHRNFVWLNELTERLDMPESENMRISVSVMKVFGIDPQEGES